MDATWLEEGAGSCNRYESDGSIIYEISHLDTELSCSAR